MSRFESGYRSNAASAVSKNQRFQPDQAFPISVGNLPIAAVSYDRNFCRIYVSPAYLQIVINTGAEILGKSVEELWWPTNISAQAYRKLLEEVMYSGRETEVTLEWADEDGRVASYIEKLVPEYDSSGEIAGVSVLVVDISILRQQQVLESRRLRVFEKLAHGDALDCVLEQVAAYVEAAKPGVYCSVLLLDEEQKHSRIVVAPLAPELRETRLNMRILAHEAGCCSGLLVSVSRAERLILDDCSKHACSRSCQIVLRETGAAGCWFEPIFSSSRQLLGVLCLYLKTTGMPGQSDLALLREASHLSVLAIERKRLEQKIYSQACYDPLTNLPNRRLFGNRLHEEIVKAERGDYAVAVLFIDLDHFKEVNDTWGHEAGDGLLLEAAQRLQLCVRESDTVARLGGDEFVMLLPEAGNAGPLERLAQNIVSVMQQPFYYGEYSFRVSASVGIAIYPADAVNSESLLRCADQAMYAAKETGRNSYSFFTRHLSESERQRSQLSNDLRNALGKGQLDVYYQPIMDVGNGQVVKAEALLRWHHPEFGEVPLELFIPIAQETDAILDIGAWVFQEAVETAKRWNALIMQQGLKKISINMSVRELTTDRESLCILDYLKVADLDPGQIVIEITEDLLLNNCPKLAEKLENLRTQGIQFSLDDFGTGISAISHLRRANIDYLKIDRSIIRELETNPDNRAMVEAIVTMVHRMGLKVIAEGVETIGQGALLMSMGCELQQGYLYCHPMPVEAFLAFIQRPRHLPLTL